MALFILLITIPVFADSGMWQGFPQGWVYAPVQGYDSWPGIYHDGESGACILFDVGWPFVIAPVKKGSEGTQQSIPYKLKTSNNQKCRKGITWDVSFFPEPAEAREYVWNASADMCDEIQKLRVKEFLFGANSSPITNLPKHLDFRRLKRSEFLAIPLGMTYSEVINHIGLPSDSECGPDLGFTAIYYETEGKSWLDHKFIFDREHRLKLKKLSK
jgi:hypothetical protein